MKTAIIVAMSKELNLLLPLLENHSRTTINDVEFHTGNIGRHQIVAMQCGIGKVNAAVGALSLTDTFHPDLVINTGVAGGTGAADVLDVVIGTGVGYHDLWCGPGTAPGQVPGCPQLFPCALPAQYIDRLEGVKRGVIASGDVFVTEEEQVRRILEMYPDAKAVDMESAAIAQVCYMKNVPFVAMRVISDTPGKADNFAQYQNFWEDAPRQTFNALMHLLELI